MQCKLCQDSGAIFLEKPAGDLYKCTSCSHLFRNLPKKEQECYREDYFSEAHKNWFSHPDYRYFEFIYQQIIKYMGSRELRLLDIGCGRGDFLKYLAKKNSKIKLYGIDLMHSQYPGIDFIEGDFIEYSPGTKFDVISAFGVIEHIDSLHQFIKKIGDLLSPNGLVLIMTIDSQGMIFRIARLLRRIGTQSAYRRLYNERHHLHLFTRKSLKLAMQRNNFEIFFANSHNYPLNAVDFPKTHIFIKTLYLYAVGLIFFLSAMFKNGIAQTIICKKVAR